MFSLRNKEIITELSIIPLLYLELLVQLLLYKFLQNVLLQRAWPEVSLDYQR